MNIPYDLVLKASKGDREAFEQLYKLTCKSVYFTCLSLLKNDFDASDAASETYLTALTKLSELENKEKFSAWLNRIAVNKCRDHLKKKNPQPLDEENEENLPLEEDENFLPEDYIANREKRRIVMEIMKKTLSPIQYETVILYYFDGLTTAEIAELTNCPMGTVTYRLSVSRGKIKEDVLKYEEQNDDRLHGIAGIPFLSRLLGAEAESIDIPPINQELLSKVKEISKKSESAKTAERGAKKIFNTVKSKVIAGIVAVAVVGGGITAGVVLSGNNSDDDGEPLIIANGKSVSSTNQSSSAEETDNDTATTEPETDGDDVDYTDNADDTDDTDTDSETSDRFDLADFDLESDPHYPDAITLEYNDYSIDISAGTTPETVRSIITEEPQTDNNTTSQTLGYGELSGWWDAVTFDWYNGTTDHLHTVEIMFSEDHDISFIGVSTESTPEEIAYIFGTPIVSEITYAGGGNYDPVQTLSWDNFEIGDEVINHAFVEYKNNALYEMIISFE